MRTCVIILGMHRSGTSALAGVLHILGLNLGKDLLAGNEFNIKGYFENRKLYIIHERLLRSLNSGWHDDADLPLGWHVWPALDAYKEEIKQVLVGDFGSSDTFCLKDPRFAILLPLYVEIFNELMIDPCFIIMKRSIPEIMQSLNARDGLPEDRILALYSKYAACIETYTLGKKRITLSFDDLLNNTEKTIDVIKNGLGLQLKEYALVEKEVRGFLEHQLKHYHVTDVGYIQQLREEIKSNKQALRYHDRRISDLLDWIHQQDLRIYNLTCRLAEIEKIKVSNAFKIMSYFWKLMDALFPHATRRRLGYDSLVKAIAFLLPRELSADELFTRRIVTRIKAPRPLEFKPEKNPVASIIIPVCNKWQFTYLCLHSILINTAQVAYEVIVVDNGSRDKTHALLGKVKHITHIRLARNEGFSVACNTGAQVAHGDYLVFLNNDTLVTKGWLYALLQVFQDDIGVGLVGSKLIRPGNKLKEAGGIVWKNGDACNYGASGNPQSYAYNYRKEVDYCSAASVMVAKQVFNSVGGFDMKFSPAYFEDTDLAFKLRQKGFKVIYQPCSAVLHFEGITGGRDCKKGYKRFQEKHKETFFSQWRDVIVQEQCDQSEGPFRARDRSQHKDIMLFIDQTIPRYDKDAGSFITFRYLQLFKELGFKIIFCPQDLLVRQPYCADLQQMGLEVVYGKVSFDEFIATHGRFIDVAVVSRPEVAAVFLDPLQRNSKAKIAYVPHDLHYVREHGHGLFDFKRNSASEWRALKALEKRIMGRVNVSLFFSDKETNMARKEFPGIKAEQINWIQEVSVRESKISPFDERAGILFLGWFGHLPNVDSLRWFHDDILPGIYNKIPNVVTTVIGDDIPDDIQRFASKLFLFQGALNEEELTNCFSKARLFVAPLRFGAGIKGKIAKSMSYGVPVVTTSIGAEGMGLIDGENAFIADSNDEFAQKLVELYCNKTVWQKFSQQSMALIKERYSKDSARKKIEKIFRGYGILDEDNRGN